MEEIDPILRGLVASASAFKTQESCYCTKNLFLSSHKNIGLLLVLILVLTLASERTFIWPKILPQILTIMVSSSFFTRKRTGNNKIIKTNFI